MKVDVEESARGVEGRVKVGMAAVAAPALLREVVRRMQTQAPRVIIEIQEGSLSWLIDALLTGAVDCMLSRLSEDTSSLKLHRENLYEEGVSIVARFDHPIFENATASAQTLSEAQWILPSRGAPMRESVNRSFAIRRLPTPQPAIESVSVVANLSILRSSDLLAFLPEPIAADFERLVALKIVKTELQLAMPPVGLVLRNQPTLSRATQRFLPTVKEAALTRDEWLSA